MAINMPHTVKYPDDSYSEDLEGSQLYQSQSLAARPVLLTCFFGGVIICWLSFFLVPHGGKLFSIAVGFIIVILGINYSNSKPIKSISRCCECNGKRVRESHEGCDFFVCRECKSYIRGGDYS